MDDRYVDPAVLLEQCVTEECRRCALALEPVWGVLWDWASPGSDPSVVAERAQDWLNGVDHVVRKALRRAERVVAVDELEGLREKAGDAAAAATRGAVRYPASFTHAAPPGWALRRNPDHRYVADGSGIVRAVPIPGISNYPETNLQRFAYVKTAPILRRAAAWSVVLGSDVDAWDAQPSIADLLAFRTRVGNRARDWTEEPGGVVDPDHAPLPRTYARLCTIFGIHTVGVCAPRAPRKLVDAFKGTI